MLGPFSVALFDSGGPIIAAAAVVAIPVCFALAVRRWRDVIAVRRPLAVYGLSIPLLMAGVVPGTYIGLYAVLAFGPVP